MTTAFVLSGGGSLGAVQVGMLHALADRRTTPDLLVGASAGALNSAFIAGREFTSASVDELDRVWRSVRGRHVFPLVAHRQLLALAGMGSSFCSSHGLRRLIASHLSYGRLQDATIPIHVVATDVLTGEEVLLSRGDPVSAVLASCSIPAVLPPVDIDGRLLFDGGIADNTPISQAVSLGADRIYVLPAGVACALETPPRSALGMAVHALTLLIDQRLAFDVAAYRDRVELIVLPPLCPSKVSAIGFLQTGTLIERARRGTHHWLDSAGSHAAQPERFLSLHSHTGPDADHSCHEGHAA